MRNGNPTDEEVLRGVAALVPFVHSWQLPLNAEEFHEMAWAVLFYAGSEDSLAVIETEVGRQLAEYNKASRRMVQRMADRLLEQKRHGDSESRISKEGA